MAGRKKGSKNLARVGDSYFNQHRVEITVEEKRELENEVRKANRLRKRMLAEEAELPRKVYGVEIDDKVSSLQAMGKESDFIVSQKSASLQRFRSREDFERYRDYLKRVNSKGYIDERTRQYKRNYAKALDQAFGDEAKDIKMKIRMMKPKDYRKLIQQDETLEISYVYNPNESFEKLEEIRAALGMKSKEDW